LEANYLAMGLMNFILTLSPQRIVMGGGVMEQKLLFPMVRSRVRSHLNSYLDVPDIIQDIDSYIVPPKLGAKAGFSGAFALAAQALG